MRRVALTKHRSGTIRGGHGHARRRYRQAPPRSRHFTDTDTHGSPDTDTGKEKEALCLSLGAEKWIDFKETADLVKAIKNACDGRGAHTAVVTSPYSEGYAQAVDYLRPGGTLMAVGIPAEATLDASIFWTVVKVGGWCTLREAILRRG